MICSYAWLTTPHHPESEIHKMHRQDRTSGRELLHVNELLLQPVFSYMKSRCIPRDQSKGTDYAPSAIINTAPLSILEYLRG